MTFHDLLVNRRSVRKFQAIAIEEEKIELIKKAALRSPTGKRKNHWEFVFVQDKEMLKKLSQSKTHGSSLIDGAALAVIVVGNPEVSDTWIEDCSIASIIIQLQAEDLGLGSCWVQIYQRYHNESISAHQYIKEQINLSEPKQVLSIIAIGYPENKRAPLDDSELLYQNIITEKYSS